MEITRIFDILSHYEEICPDKTDAVAGKDEGAWKTYSTADFINKTNYVSAGLLALGIKKGDKIATITFNRSEWNFLYWNIANRRNSYSNISNKSPK
ncbi:MAG: hypothetical protein KGZ97_04145 [Bacteroidetes bacterium]|nr:hypothetical protein [Bacteroidota bacterium]